MRKAPSGARNRPPRPAPRPVDQRAEPGADQIDDAPAADADSESVAGEEDPGSALDTSISPKPADAPPVQGR